MAFFPDWNLVIFETKGSNPQFSWWIPFAFAKLCFSSVVSHKPQGFG